MEELQAEFDRALASDNGDTLEQIRVVCVQQLRAAIQSHKHPWRTGVIASVADGRPAARTVVLRGVDDEPLSLRFHTDVRSPKITQLNQNPGVEWLFYFAPTRVQLRVAGTAAVVREGERWQAAWTATNVKSRRCYLGPYAPSDTCETMTANLPDDLLDCDPTLERSEAGSVNFAIVECRVESLDFLMLKHTGHVRCKFGLVDGKWSHDWAAP